MCLVEIAVNPLLVNSIASAIPRKGVHVSRGFLELRQILVMVINQDILIIDVVASWGETGIIFRKEKRGK